MPFVPFDPPPPPQDAPVRFPSPFHPGPPHAWAERAALETQQFLARHVPMDAFYGRFGGKMIGVAVVRTRAGRVGYVRAFAGMLEGRWLADGFVPPAFDRERFEALWAEGGRRVTRLDEQITRLRDVAEPTASQCARLDELVEAQRAHSRRLLTELRGTYEIANAKGEAIPLESLFLPRRAPGGAGDCAGPKLLAFAHRHGLQPVAMAEFWWGGSPPGGGRHHRVFYPACRGKCGPILPFMLEGIDCEPPPDVGMREVPASAPAVVHDDPDLVVVDKPCGLLSVPGRGPTRRDSVEHRLQQRDPHGDGTWPRLVHRLDVATSGLLIAAKHRDAYVGLQRQFSGRTLGKRYVALVHGELDGDRGVVALPLRGDLDDRPRQIHDPDHGKSASTRWEVLERGEGITRVALIPHTGRTHQLRVHAAHPRGLAAPIVGDLLYGFGGGRLMLHAESLAFVHPRTGQPFELCVPAPF